MTRLALTVSEAAQSLGIGRTSFYEHVLPELRVVKVGSRVLVPVSELQRYLEWQASEEKAQR